MTSSPARRPGGHHWHDGADREGKLGDEPLLGLQEVGGAGLSIESEPATSLRDERHLPGDFIYCRKETPAKRRSGSNRRAGEREGRCGLKVATENLDALRAALEVVLHLALLVRPERPDGRDGDEQSQLVVAQGES
jgi:hypothetical protein